MKQNDRPKTHFIAEYLANPIHPITVDLIGCGGSGSIMLSCLASINNALLSLGKRGIRVTAYDDDDVSEANIGRQLFSPSELYANKADVLISRFNRIFGTNWISVPEKYSYNEKTNILISCTDNVESRKYISRFFGKSKNKNYDEFKNYYWLDMGNSQTSGQAVLGSTCITQPKSSRFSTIEHLPTVIEMFPLKKSDDKKSGPSCSLAEALEKQDLFINRAVATMAADILWKLLKEGHLETHGFFMNLTDSRMVPIQL